MLITAEGIVLSRQKKGESDMQIQIITKEGELLMIRIYGILVSKKRNINVTEPGSLITVTFYVSAEEGAYSCKEAHLIERFPAVKETYDALIVTAYILDLTLSFSKGEKDPAFFNLIFSGLGRLNRILKSDRNRIKDKYFLLIFLLFFKVRLLSCAGLLGFSEKSVSMKKSVSAESDRNLFEDESESLREAALRYRFHEFYDFCKSAKFTEDHIRKAISFCDSIIIDYLQYPVRSQSELMSLVG